MRAFASCPSILALLGPALVGLAGDGAATEAPSCLTPGETREWVGAARVVPPEAAVLAAHRAVPQADILRASLCQGPAGPVYVLLALRRDGRLVRVTIDAPSGTIARLR